MLTRRMLLASIGGASIGAAFTFATPARAADDWRVRYPEIVFAATPAENVSGVSERFGPFVAYLARTLGVKVTLRFATDYAAAIEGQKAGNIHIVAYGPASYVRAHTVTNGGVEPFVTTINANGSIGYYAVGYVRANDPAQSLEDMKGRNLGLVDPNSSSGNAVPRYAMNRMGIDPARFFAKVLYTGSHENAVLALKQGTIDLAFNWWNTETDSNLSRMAIKGMVKAEDYRIIFKSPLIAGAPYAYLTALPAAMKQAILQAFMDAQTTDKAAFDRLSEGKDLGFIKVTHADYISAMELQDFMDQLRKQRN